MKGVMRASVSAGSSQRDASVTWSPQVIVPSGAASAGCGARHSSPPHSRRTPIQRERRRAEYASLMMRLRAPKPGIVDRLMAAVLPGGRLRDYPRTARLVNDSGRQTCLVAREPAVPAPVRLLDVLEDDVDLVGGRLADLHHRLGARRGELPLLVLGASRVPLDRAVGHCTRLLTLPASC